jgi:hypothetical protein
VRVVPPALVDATIVLATSPEGHDAWARLDASAAERLGVDGITPLLIRPDGHVGLPAEDDHLEALAAYQAPVASCRR